ncbi:hypothetical protein C1H46_025639 [Malus baccata]|uniref:Uncharacterized protein n=1 Tax=Malus baccata TaxID=106549 RepID=A0A540LQH6_MALBA|nr:hypothetical protein C1H46_025639 [Malus baccata]
MESTTAQRGGGGRRDVAIQLEKQRGEVAGRGVKIPREREKGVAIGAVTVLLCCGGSLLGWIG